VSTLYRSNNFTCGTMLGSTIPSGKEEGKVLHWGISINDHAPATALRALADPIFESAQVIYNIYDRSAQKALFELAKTKPLGVIVRVPFDEGALTGRIRSDTVFPTGDFQPVTGESSTSTATGVPRPNGGQRRWPTCSMTKSRRCLSSLSDSVCRHWRCRR
jgi:hypothetical protein